MGKKIYPSIQGLSRSHSLGIFWNAPATHAKMACFCKCRMDRYEPSSSVLVTMSSRRQKSELSTCASWQRGTYPGVDDAADPSAAAVVRPQRSAMEDALIEVATIRRFAGIALITDRIPDGDCQER
jgi:hypothetical protein